MNHLDGLIFLSNSGVDSRFDDLAIARQLNATKINIVPNALSDTGLALLNKIPKRLEDRHKIIAVGSFHWQKGFDFVLRAYALSNACNKIPLHLYGYESGVFCNSLRLLIKKLKIQEDFVFFNYGFSGRALAAEYEDAVLFLSGSHTECQPLVLLDAIAAGVPFIARATGCIDSMQGGVVISSELQMAYQLDYLLTDHVKWFELSAAGRTSAFENHHPEYISHKLNTILSSCSVN
jgi:glycosyltransferase involved in cell wall biosynthesis